jgi:hypothetical protein
VGPTGEYVSPATLARLEHEHSLAGELDPRCRPERLERRPEALAPMSALRRSSDLLHHVPGGRDCLYPLYGV